ncbi:response regulator [Aminobacter anthyllidis]|uniref:Response regulator n=1 Tax=Aminobacter anthyllidis TaxID=1035067 RepID=A0A9X1D8N2_9HYPH|nr:response regulator [Aminobacter anthyllidis]MBT1159286.1 response regulator [Aminobacter anthyllidis]
MERPLVLVVEDEALIAWDMECALSEAGVRLATSCSEANRFLENHTPAAAVLDVRLSDGDCYEAAKTLADRRVPFVVYTGLGVEGSHEAFSLGVTILKPTEPAEVARLLKAMTAGLHQRMAG